MEYATKAGITIPEEYVFEEDNYTGKVADRPVLSRILKLAQEGKIQCIVVYLVDRWARDVGAGAELINRVFKLGLELHFVSWGTSVRDTPMDYARYNMEILFSDVERRTIVNRLYDGKVNKSKLGFITGAGRHVRFGYKRVERNTPHGRIRDLDINDEQSFDHDTLSSPAKVVHWMFTQVSQRKGMSAICDLLNDIYNIKRPSGTKWDTSDLYKMIRATEYYGQFYYGKTDGRKKKPAEERIAIYRKDLAIVDKELWDKANGAIGEASGREPKYEFLLSRRVWCMNGHKMKCQPSQTPQKLRLYYMCKRRRFLEHSCTMPFIFATAVDEAVFGWVVDLLKDPEAKLKGMQKAQLEAVGAVNDLSRQVADCDTAIARDEKELDHLYQDRKQYRDNKRMLSRIEHDITETIERIERVRTNREEYLSKMECNIITDEEITSRVGEIDRINAVLEQIGELTFEQRRRLIELLDIRIVLGVEEARQYVDVLWYGDSQRRWLDGGQWLDSPMPG